MTRTLKIVFGLIAWGVAMHNSMADGPAIRASAPMSACGRSATGEVEMPSSPAIQREHDLLVARALADIESGNQVRKGVQTIERIAGEGSSTARYWVGMLYMMGKGVQQDTVMALRYFGQVRGDFWVAATTQSAVIYARGSGKVTPNHAKAEQMLREAETCFLDAMEMHSSVPATDDEMISRMRWYEGSALLYGYARELGITLKKSLAKE
jgi:hypothetical protein